MRWMIGASIRFRGLVLAVAAGMIVFGIVQLPQAPVDTLPEFQPTIVEVQTEALGLSAEEVEQLITVPLEQDLLNGVAFLEGIESVSLPGLSSVVLTFEPGTDLLDARQVVGERLTQAVGVAGLPEVAKPPQMLQPLSSTNRVAMVKLASTELTPIEVSVLARWVIGPRLLGVQGVANVAIWGQRDRQLQVLVDPQRLRDQGVRLGQVIASAGNAMEVSPLSYLEASAPGTGGFIDTLNQRLQVFHEQAIKTAEELEQIPLEDEDGAALFVNGQAVTLGDVTTVVEGHQPLIGDAFCSDGDCQLLVIEKFPGANTAAVAAGIEAALEVMRPGLTGLEMDTSIYRPADFIAQSFANLGTTAVVGAILLLAVLALFMSSWRALVIAVVAIAASLASAIVVLIATGATFNMLVVAGLLVALAALVDDVVLDMHRLAGRIHAEDHRGLVPAARRVTLALLETRTAALYATLVMAAASVPFFFLEGIGGAFLPPIIGSYLLAVAASLLVALALTPALSFLVLDGTPPAEGSRLIRRLRKGYDRASSRMRFGTVLAVFLVVMVLGVISAALLDRSFRPSLEERDLLVQVTTEPGTSLTQMDQLTAALVSDLAAVEGVRSVGAHVGRAIMSDQVVNVNSGEVWVTIEPDAAYEQTRAAIEGVVGSHSGLTTAILTHSQERVDRLLGGGDGDHDIVVRVYGEDPAILAEKATEIHRLLTGIEGIQDPQIETVPDEDIIQVTVDLTKAQAVGLKPGDVRRSAAILLGGITVGNLFDEQKVFDVVVWGEPQLRESAEQVQNLLIDTPSFGPVRLGAIAEVAVVPNPTEIRHESVFSYLDVTAATTGRPAEAVAADVDAAMAQVAFPLEHRAELLGGFADARNNRLLVLAVAAGTAVFAFLLLQAAFASWKLALLVFLTLPMAVAGGLGAAWLSGGSLGLGTTVALLAILGLAARQAVASIRHYQHLQRTEGLPFGPELARRGTRDRLGPTMTTTLAALAAFLPFAVAGGAGSSIVQPMAVVMIGGLIAAALLGLLVLPAVYLRFGFVEQPVVWGDELFDVSLPELEDQAPLEAQP